MKKVIAAFLCSAWLMLGGATGESGQAQAQEKKLTDITFSLDFITLGRHAPFYVAIDKGYYKEEGLNVNIVPAKGTAQGIQNVEAGIAQIGFTDIAESGGRTGRGLDSQGGGSDLPEGTLLLLLTRSWRQRHEAEGL